MQKSGLLTIIFGLLIIVGLTVSVVENQVTLEGISQGNGKVSVTDTVTITVEMDRKETTTGIFAVQLMELEKDTVSAKILDPSDTEIISRTINTESLEEEFDVSETGTYQLIIKSLGNKEIYVTGAIGPLPDADKKLIFSGVAMAILIVGMAGLVITGLTGIKNKRDQLR